MGQVEVLRYIEKATRGEWVSVKEIAVKTKQTESVVKIAVAKLYKKKRIERARVMTKGKVYLYRRKNE